MARSLKKGPYVADDVVKKVTKAKSDGSNTTTNTRSRSSTITPDMVGVTVMVHRGNGFIPVLIDEDKVGHKLGEFVPTKKFPGHGGKKAA